MNRDETMPTGRWAFDADVADVFDDMLARSIPQLEVVRGLVTDLADAVTPAGGTVLDIGCSRGGAIAALAERRPDLRFIGTEVSEPMIDAARERFADASNVTIARHDVIDEPLSALDLGDPERTTVIAHLTVQFTPIEERQRLLRRIREHASTLLLVEKVLGSTADLDELLVDRYYAMKSRNGYSDEAIRTKRLALRGVLVPLTAAFNEAMLSSAGFGEVDSFWRCLNFAGWIAR